MGCIRVYCRIPSAFKHHLLRFYSQFYKLASLRFPENFITIEVHASSFVNICRRLNFGLPHFFLKTSSNKATWYYYHNQHPEFSIKHVTYLENSEHTPQSWSIHRKLLSTRRKPVLRTGIQKATYLEGASSRRFNDYNLYESSAP